MMTHDTELMPRTVQATPARLAEPAPPVEAIPTETLQQALAGWAAAWSSRDFPRYRAYYAKSFTPEHARPLEQWASERAVRLARPGDITVGIDDLKASTPEADRAVTEFRQTYASPTYQDVSIKRLDWVREGNRWKIQREQMQGSPQNLTVPELIKKPTNRKKRTRTRDCKCD